MCKKHVMVYYIIVYCFLPYHLCQNDYDNTSTGGTTVFEEPAIAPLIRMMSERNQNRLDMAPDYDVNKPKKQKEGYEHFHPAMLENVTETRRLMWWLGWSNPGQAHINKLCHILVTTWRRAKRDMLSYYKLRELYAGTMDYEIGYVTHVIISKYMDTLEIFNIVRYRFLTEPTSNYAPTQWVWFMYTNIVDNTQHIINLCNMIHEIKKKYETSLGDTVWDDIGAGGGKKGDRFGKKGNEEGKSAALSHKEYLERQEKLRRKKAKLAMKRYRDMQKFTYTMRDTKKTRPVQYWTKQASYGLDYGWSIEDWW